MTLDTHRCIFVFHQYLAHGIQHAMKLGANVVLICVESDITGHNQGDSIALPAHLYATVLQLLAQDRFLPIHIVTYTAAHGGTRYGTGQYTTATITAAGRGHSHSGLGNRTDNGTGCGFAGLLLARVRVLRGTSGQQEGRQQYPITLSINHFFLRTPTVRYLHATIDRKSTRLNSSHVRISYAVFCL